MRPVEQNDAQDASSSPLPTNISYTKISNIQPRVDPERYRRPPLRWTAILLIVALLSTAIILSIPRLFHGSSVEKPCSSKFPACDPISLETQTRLPLPVRQCETLLPALAMAILIHWLCLSTLFQDERWKERYLSQAIFIVGGVTMMAGQMIKDPAVLFIQILPAIADMCAVACICLDLALY